jgi:hypothetical protein
MNDKNGGPAFPNEGGAGNLWNDKGMTLRDYFATHATEEDICTAINLVKNEEVVRDLGNGHKVIDRGYPSNARQIARYIHADMMLKAMEA